MGDVDSVQARSGCAFVVLRRNAVEGVVWLGDFFELEVLEELVPDFFGVAVEGAGPSRIFFALREVPVSRSDGMYVGVEGEGGADFAALGRKMLVGTSGEVGVDDAEGKEVWGCCFGLEKDRVCSAFGVDAVGDTVMGGVGALDRDERSSAPIGVVVVEDVEVWERRAQVGFVMRIQMGFLEADDLVFLC